MPHPDRSSPGPPITSRQNARVKEALALRDRATRAERGETLVYGAREALRAAAAGAEVRRVFVCPELLRGPEGPGAADQLRGFAGEALTVSPEVFERLAYGDRLDGVVAVVGARERGLGELRLEGVAAPLVVVVEGVEKPGNLGAILRTADGAGVDAVVLCDGAVDLFNPNAIRASVATAFKPNVAVAPSAETLAWLVARGVTPYALRPDAGASAWDADLRGPVAVVLGSEARGLSGVWRGAGVRGVSLPMLGVGDSLNLSVTAGVLMYEARRQRSGS